MNKEKFRMLLEETKREGVDKLYLALEKTDFFVAPASTQYHLSVEGGLLQHSLNVADCIKMLCKSENAKDCNITLIALLHDICKINCYESYDRNVKKDGVWVQEKCYKWNTNKVVYGHGAESVEMAGNYIKLTQHEKFAIRYHMGAYEETDIKNLSGVYRKYQYAFWLHTADVLSCMAEE